MLALLLAASIAPRVAVLELRNKLGPAERGAFDGSYLTDLVRSGMLKAAPSLDLMTRENVLVILQAQGKTIDECEGECEVDTARRLGADLVVSGDIVHFGTAVRISLRLHDVHSSRLLGASQASGVNADDLVQAIPAATAELARVLGPVRAPEPVAGPRPPWWRQVWLRDAGQLMAGYGYDTVNTTPRFGVRIFGVEFRYATGAHFQETVGSEFHTADWKGGTVALSPLSLSTGTYGEAAPVELVYFEPSLGYQFGTINKSSNGAAVSISVGGLQMGTRAYLKIALSRAVGLCFGGEVAYGFFDWKSVLAPTSTATFGGPNLTLAFFGGFALTLGAP